MTSNNSFEFFISVVPVAGSQGQLIAGLIWTHQDKLQTSLHINWNMNYPIRQTPVYSGMGVVIGALNELSNLLVLYSTDMVSTTSATDMF